MRIGSLSKFVHTDDFRPAKKDLKESALGGAALGGAVGAAVGAGIGYADHLDTLRNPVATVTDETYYSQQPELVGASYDDVDRRRRYNHIKEKWETKREDDDWDPIIRKHDHKLYRRPNFETDQRSLGASVLGGALKGAVIGGVLGAATATAMRAAGVEGVNTGEMLKDKRATMLIGGAAGAIIGGVAGHHAGQVAQQNALVEVRTAPVYERQQIGWQPLERNASAIAREFNKGSGDYELYYSELEGRHGSPPFEGQDPVYARVPVGEVQEEYRSTALTPLTGALGGAVIGGALGVAVGAATSVVSRVLEA